MDTRKAVATRLIQLCEARHITINKLATTSAVSASTLKGILYGRSKNPGIVTLKKLCDGLGITIRRIFQYARI